MKEADLNLLVGEEGMKDIVRLRHQEDIIMMVSADQEEAAGKDMKVTEAEDTVTVREVHPLLRRLHHRFRHLLRQYC